MMNDTKLDVNGPYNREWEEQMLKESKMYILTVLTGKIQHDSKELAALREDNEHLRKLNQNLESGIKQRFNPQIRHLAGGEEVMSETVNSTSDERIVNNVMQHEYKVLSENEKIDMKAIKDAGLDFHNHLDTIASHSENSRELALARTKIEEAVMWAVKHITG